LRNSTWATIALTVRKLCDEKEEKKVGEQFQLRPYSTIIFRSRRREVCASQIVNRWQLVSWHLGVSRVYSWGSGILSGLLMIVLGAGAGAERRRAKPEA